MPNVNRNLFFRVRALIVIMETISGIISCIIVYSCLVVIATAAINQK